MFRRDLKEISFIYLLLRPRFHSEIIWGGYRCIVIFSLVRDNLNFPVFKATEQITKCTQSCLEKMRKYASKMKEETFLSMLNQNFPRGACPWNLLAAWALRDQVTCPKSGLCNYPLGATPVTTCTTATAEQNSIENAGFGFFWPEYAGSPLEVVHLFRSEYSDRNLSFHFWQTGSLPLLGNSEDKQTVARAIPIGWPGLIGKCRSILLGNSHWSLTVRFGIMESTPSIGVWSPKVLMNPNRALILWCWIILTEY